MTKVKLRQKKIDSIPYPTLTSFFINLLDAVPALQNPDAHSAHKLIGLNPKHIFNIFYMFYDIFKIKYCGLFY